MKYLLYMAIISFFCSCNSKQNLTITFDQAGGLKEGSRVLLNDLQIGEVLQISLDQKFNVNAEIELVDSIKLPKDSKFTIQAEDFYTKAIVVEPGSSRSFLKSSDKIFGKVSEGLELDSLLDIISEEMNNSKAVKNQDSIIYELNSLKKELKEINKKI